MAGLDRFVAYPGSLASISARAQGVGMGHWTITVTTRVGSFLIDTSSHHFEIPIDYPDTRQAIYTIRDAIEDDFEGAWPAMTAVQAWIGDGLQSLAPTVVAAGSCGDLDAAVAAAAAARDLCASAVEALTKVAASQSDHVEAVRALRATISDESLRRSAELQLALGAEPAGRDDALAQFSVFQSILAASLATLTEAVHDLVNETAAVLSELGAVAATAVQLVGDLERSRSLLASGVDQAVVQSTFDLDGDSGALGRPCFLHGGRVEGRAPHTPAPGVVARTSDSAPRLTRAALDVGSKSQFPHSHPARLPWPCAALRASSPTGHHPIRRRKPTSS